MIKTHEVFVKKQIIGGRRRARRLALQALYQWLMSQDDLYEIEVQFRLNNNMIKINEAYFCHLLYEVPRHIKELEKKLEPFLDRAIESLNPIEHTVLWIGAFELSYCPDIPYRVVLDEAISLTKEFGSQDGHRYVNGVLNNLAQEVRRIEIKNG